MWVVTEIDSVQDARDYFESLKDFLLSDVRLDQSLEDDLNGMPSRRFSGTARKGKEPVDWKDQTNNNQEEFSQGTA